jgi:hypothetical protein
MRRHKADVTRPPELEQAAIESRFKGWAKPGVSLERTALAPSLVVVGG